MEIQTAPKLLTSRIIVDTEINPFHQLYALKPSDVVRIGDMQEVNQTTHEYVKVKELSVPDCYGFGGRIRVKWQAKCTSQNGLVRVYVDGVPVGAEKQVLAGAYPGDMSDDIAIDGPGLIQLYAKVVNNPIFVKDFTICADDVIIAAAKGSAW